jgi:soluble cytochrome b562
MKEHIKEIEQREEIAADKEDLQKLRNEIQEADKWVETRKR